jgi:glutamine amidotransferase
MTKPTVVVLDYGSGNLRSAERALARAGAEVTVTPSLVEAAEADGLVVPGVGAFAACMAGIEEVGAGPVIEARVRAGQPVLGICVGMQILFEYGDEHGVVTKGLGLVPGGVTRIDAPVVPHMGWNTVAVSGSSVLFGGLAPDTRFYFVHSIHNVPFVAAVEAGPLMATQFHPEKSGDAGAALLRNWLATVPAGGQA